MENEFTDAMTKRTDEQLIKIVTADRDGYQPLAILAAEHEIQKRNINTLQVEEVKTVLTSQREEENTFEESKVSSGIRLLHFVIDTIAIILLSLILSFIFGLFFKTTNQAILQFVGVLLIAVSFIAYYIFMENKFQKTFGKFATKTKVVTKNGRRAELGDIVRRTFCRLIPLDNFSYLFTRNGFHDYLSNTTVVKDK